MRIPRFRNTVSPSTARAQVRPVLRSQPAMASAVTYNPNAFMRNPRAGQRNVQAEAQAELDKAKPLMAAMKGINAVAETFARADMDASLLSANLEMQAFAQSSTAAMSDLPIAKQKTTTDGVTGATTTSYQGTYETSFQTVEAALVSKQKQLVETLPLSARASFLAKSANIISASQDDAAKIAQKQHIEFLKFQSIESLNNKVSTLDGVDAWTNSESVRVSMGGYDIAQKADIKKQQISVDHYGAQLLQIDLSEASARMNLDKFIDELQSGMSSELIMKEGGAELITVESPYAAQLRPEQKEKLISSAFKKIEQIDKLDKEKRDKNFSTLVVDVLRNPQGYNEESFLVLLNNHSIEPEQFDKIVKYHADAKSPDPEKPNDQLYLQMISDPSQFTVDEILSSPGLKTEQRIKALNKHETYQTNLNTWDSKNHPIHRDLGHRAVKKLKLYLKIPEEGQEVSVFQRQVNTDKRVQKFFEAYTELENLMMDKSTSPEEAPQIAFDWVNQYIEKDMNQSPPESKQSGTFSEADYINYEVLTSSNPTIPKTLEDVLTLQGTAARKRIHKILDESGITLPPNYLDQPSEDEQVEKAGEEPTFDWTLKGLKDLF